MAMLVDETSAHNEFEWAHSEYVSGVVSQLGQFGDQAIPQTVGGQTNMFTFEYLFSCNWFLHKKIIAKTNHVRIIGPEPKRIWVVSSQCYSQRQSSMVMFFLATEFKLQSRLSNMQRESNSQCYDCIVRREKESFFGE